MGPSSACEAMSVVDASAVQGAAGSVHLAAVARSDGEVDWGGFIGLGRRSGGANAAVGGTLGALVEADMAAAALGASGIHSNRTSTDVQRSMDCQL